MAGKDLRELYGADLLAAALKLKQTNEGLIKELQKKQKAILGLEGRVKEIAWAIALREAEGAGKSGYCSGVPIDQNPYSVKEAHDQHIAWRVAWYEAETVSRNENDVEALTNALFSAAEESGFQDWETIVFDAATQSGVSETWMNNNWFAAGEEAETEEPKAEKKVKGATPPALIDTRPKGGNGKAKSP